MYNKENPKEIADLESAMESYQNFRKMLTEVEEYREKNISTLDISEVDLEEVISKRKGIFDIVKKYEMVNVLDLEEQDLYTDLESNFFSKVINGIRKLFKAIFKAFSNLFRWVFSSSSPRDSKGNPITVETIEKRGKEIIDGALLTHRKKLVNYLVLEKRFYEYIDISEIYRRFSGIFIENKNGYHEINGTIIGDDLYDNYINLIGLVEDLYTTYPKLVKDKLTNVKSYDDELRQILLVNFKIGATGMYNMASLDEIIKENPNIANTVYFDRRVVINKHYLQAIAALHDIVIRNFTIKIKEEGVHGTLLYLRLLGLYKEFRESVNSVTKCGKGFTGSLLTIGAPLFGNPYGSIGKFIVGYKDSEIIVGGIFPDEPKNQTGSVRYGQEQPKAVGAWKYTTCKDNIKYNILPPTRVRENDMLSLKINSTVLDDLIFDFKNSVHMRDSKLEELLKTIQDREENYQEFLLEMTEGIKKRNHYLYTRLKELAPNLPDEGLRYVTGKETLDILEHNVDNVMFPLLILLKDAVVTIKRHRENVLWFVNELLDGIERAKADGFFDRMDPDKNNEHWER